MAERQFPIWLVSEDKHVLNPPPNIPCKDPEAAHVFTTAERLTSFLDARKGGRWDVQLAADHDGLVVGVTDLRALGVRNVCLDPESDGTGGELLSLGELYQQFANGQSGPR